MTLEFREMAELAAWIEAHAEQKISLGGLAERFAASESRLQRRFSEVIGLSPHAYQRAIRIGRLKLGLRRGDAVSGAIYEAGFGSVSRVYENADRDFGMTPAKYRARGFGLEIDYTVCRTRLGLLIIAATDRGVCHVRFGTSSHELAQGLESEFPHACIRASDAGDGTQLAAWLAALQSHIDAGGPRPDLPLAVFGSALQVRTWRFLTSLSDGRTVSYSEVADGVEYPQAVRAVASACAANGIAVLIPCHRVLRKDGSLGGYRWGLERKRALLTGPARS